MCVYNYNKYLEEAIKGVLSQTFRDFEFIIINDCSTDGSEKIIRKYAERDKRIIVINNVVRKGLPGSLNISLKKARGEYITRHDADDISLPEKFGKQIKFLKKNNNFITVGTFAKRIDEYSNVIGKIKKPIEDHEVRGLIKSRNTLIHGTAMIKKECLFEVGLYDENFDVAHDYDMNIRLAEHFRMTNIPEYLYLYRDHSQNITNRYINEQLKNAELIRLKNRKKYHKKIVLNTQPKFSILMSNYNKSKYIDDSIQSVISQTIKDWELVIIDDSSTDDSLEKILPYLNDKRIKLIRNKYNTGNITCQKRLVETAKADIVGILDSDDVLLPDAIEKIYNAYNDNPDCGFIYSQYVTCDSNLNKVKTGTSKKIPRRKSNLHCNCIGAFRTFKKEYYYETLGYDENILYAEEKDLFFKFEEVTNLLFIDEILYKYRVLPDSQSHHKSTKIIGRISSFQARYNAYQRRLETDIPNISRVRMSLILCYGILLCLRIWNLRKIEIFLLAFFKLWIG